MTATETDAGPETTAEIYGSGRVARLAINILALVGTYHVGDAALDWALPEAHRVMHVQPLERAQACLQEPGGMGGTLSQACSSDIDRALVDTGLRKPMSSQPEYVNKGGKIVEDSPETQGVDAVQLSRRIDEIKPVVERGADGFIRNGKIAAAVTCLGFAALAARGRRHWRQNHFIEWVVYNRAMPNDPLPKKSLGQHWLQDPEALTAMCDAAEVQAGDTVLEIGPGLGTLTQLLTKRAKAVIAVEFDQALAQALPGRVSDDNLTTVSQDILSFDLTGLSPGYKVVANIPYYLTSNLIRTLSESTNPPALVTILVQKEVAERVAAAPGDMSLLSVSAQFYWDVTTGRVMKAELFSPPPKVDSQILVLKKRDEPLFSGVDIQQFFQVVKAGFASRRKTLVNSLSGGLRITKEQAGGLLEQAGVEGGLRPQSLSLPQWHDLYLAAKKQGVL